MTFAQLRALVAVVDSGGFTRAAVLTGSSQPAVSHAVAGLERELGAKLLVRHQRGVHATDVGLRVTTLARQILASGDEIRQQTAGDDAAIAAAVQVATTPAVADSVLPAALEILAARQPGIDVSTLVGDIDEIPSWLDEHLVDVAFLSMTPGVAGIDHEQLGHDDQVALVPASHPLAAAATVSLRDLADEPFAMPNGGCEPYISNLFERAGTPVRAAYRIRDATTIATIVGQGLAVSVLSAMAARGLPDDVAVRPLDPPARRAFAALWPKRRKTAAARAVVNAVATLAPAACMSGQPAARRIAGSATTAVRDGSAPNA